MTSPPLTAILCVLHAQAPAVASLPHVIELLDALLDQTVRLTLEAAVTRDSIRLVDRVLTRTLPALDGPQFDRLSAEIALGAAMQAAVRRGFLSAVQRLHTVHPRPLCTRLLRVAARHGELLTLEWLLANRSDGLCIPDAVRDDLLRTGSLTCCLREVYFEALNHEQHHVVRWLFERGFIGAIEGAGDAAAAAGDLDMVRWVHAQNVRDAFSSDALEQAASGGHVDVVRFLVENRPEQCPFAGLISAMYAHHDDVVALLREHDAVDDRENRSAIIVHAAALGRLDVLEANPRDERERWHYDYAMSIAAEHGRVEVINWLAGTLQVSFPRSARCVAAVHGHLSILQWAHTQSDEPWSVDVMNSAATHGRLAIVQWLHANRRDGCTQAAMNGAATYGHLGVVQWLHANRVEGCTSEAMNGAANSGHLAIVQWLHENRHEGCTKEAMDGAASNGHLEVVKWLHCHRTEGCSVRAMDGAARAGHLPMLHFLHEHRDEGCSWQAAVLATINRHASIVGWLRDNYPLVYDPARVADAIP